MGFAVVIPARHASTRLPGKMLADLAVKDPAAFAEMRRLRDGGLTEVHPFDEILNLVAAGKVDAGLIIHENRFTYEAKGLRKIIDLGEFWEGTTGAPIPLGGIVIRRPAATIESDFYHQFFIPPATMLEAAVGAWLRQSGLFVRVGPPSSEWPAGLLLTGHVAALYGDFSQPDQPKAVLELQLMVLDARPGAPATVLLRQALAILSGASA